MAVAVPCGAVRKGAFQAGGNANFHGKIKYAKCRKPVYTPSDWDPALADRSADLPMARLVLEFIYGYNGARPRSLPGSQPALRTPPHTWHRSAGRRHASKRLQCAAGAGRTTRLVLLRHDCCAAGNNNTAQNLFYTSEGKIVSGAARFAGLVAPTREQHTECTRASGPAGVACAQVYYTAGVGVVYHRPPVHHQSFFLGHTDDITSLALCPAAVDFDGRSFPARTLVATGQVTSTEEGPHIRCVRVPPRRHCAGAPASRPPHLALPERAVSAAAAQGSGKGGGARAARVTPATPLLIDVRRSIWDSRGSGEPGGPAMAPELVKIKFDKSDRGFTALAFSPDGTKLVAVATDNHHTVYVYDWRKQRKLSEGKGQMGDPPQVRAGPAGWAALAGGGTDSVGCIRPSACVHLASTERATARITPGEKRGQGQTSRMCAANMLCGALAV